VAVIMSCYKRLPFTRLCLPTAMENAGLDADWIITDDGSQDGTAEFLLSLAQKNPRVRARVDGENRGIARRANEGAREALALGVDAVVNLDNDILAPYGWLRDLAAAFEQARAFDVGSAWVVNDRTIRKTLTEAGALGGAERRRWVPVGGCGGACEIVRRRVFEHGCWHGEDKPLWAYEDAAFHGSVQNAGFKIGIYLGVQVWHMQSFAWPDREYEAKKLAARHAYAAAAPDKFAASLAREEGKVFLNEVKETDATLRSSSLRSASEVPGPFACPDEPDGTRDGI
jgi:GT2 family glycosyltransferase